MKRANSPEYHSAVALCQTLIAEVASQFNINMQTLRACLLHGHTSPEGNNRPTQTDRINESTCVKLTTEEQRQRYIGPNEVAIMLDIKPQTLRKQICYDTLPKGFPRPNKINGRNKWIRSDVNAYFAKDHQE